MLTSIGMEVSLLVLTVLGYRPGDEVIVKYRFKEDENQEVEEELLCLL